MQGALSWSERRVTWSDGCMRKRTLAAVCISGSKLFYSSAICQHGSWAGALQLELFIRLQRSRPACTSSHGAHAPCSSLGSSWKHTRPHLSAQVTRKGIGSKRQRQQDKPSGKLSFHAGSCWRISSKVAGGRAFFHSSYITFLNKLFCLIFFQLGNLKH